MSRLSVSRVEEVRAAGDLPLWQHPEWLERMPWLVQGITGRGDEAEPFDLGLFGAAPVGAVVARWSRLRRATGMRRVVHSRQVHGAELRSHGPADEPGLLIGDGHDGHLTRSPGVLLTISVADCVPVYLVDVRIRAVALVHAGWRGIAAGVVERAIDRLRRWQGEGEPELWMHCGPSICGECYEVGPEVHAALVPNEPAPSRPEPIDLRAVVLERAAAAGIDVGRMSVSTHCTRCGPGAFFSHRGGSAGRQMAVLGVRA
ncbi:MAG TPA: polyphenol oxidase family protein [Longimicrobiaceae bacterium]